MGDANVRRPVATRFEHGVDFGLLVHKSPFMADKRDPLVLSNYFFELLEVNPGVAGFLIQLHPQDVDAVLESVTAHAEKGAGTKTTLYVGHEAAEEVEEEVEEVEEVGAGRGKPHNPLMISAQKVRIRPGKGKGSRMVGSPNPSRTTPAGSALTTPKTSSPCTPFPHKGVGACVVWGHHSQHYFGAGGDSFSIWGNTPPYWGGGGGGCRRAIGGL